MQETVLSAEAKATIERIRRNAERPELRLTDGAVLDLEFADPSLFGVVRVGEHAWEVGFGIEQQSDGSYARHFSVSSPSGEFLPEIELYTLFLAEFGFDMERTAATFLTTYPKRGLTAHFIQMLAG